MIPAFLITFREVIEAAFIVTTVAGILEKLGQRERLKTVIKAVWYAAGVSALLIFCGSLLGYNMQTVYTGKTEQLAEGFMMTISALFITWAVFFLHDHFSGHRDHLLHRLKKSAENQEERGLFGLVFLAVFREGFEIMLFLSSIYLSSKPMDVAMGSMGGLIIGGTLAYVLFKSSQYITVQRALSISTILLVLFGAGLFARGLHEFAEVGVLPQWGNVVIPFLPQAGTFAADMTKSLFSISRKMDGIQAAAYIAYCIVVSVYLLRQKRQKPASV